MAKKKESEIDQTSSDNNPENDNISEIETSNSQTEATEQTELQDNSPSKTNDNMEQDIYTPSLENQQTNIETSVITTNSTTGNYPSFSENPGKIQAIAIMTLVNGILNILYAFFITVMVTVFTLGIGLLCAPITILPAVLGIFEIIYATKFLSTPTKATQPSKPIAILEICCILTGNPISLVVGILALVFYSDYEIQQWFAQLNNSTI